MDEQKVYRDFCERLDKFYEFNVLNRKNIIVYGNIIEFVIPTANEEVDPCRAVGN